MYVYTCYACTVWHRATCTYTCTCMLEKEEPWLGYILALVFQSGEWGSIVGGGRGVCCWHTFKSTHKFYLFCCFLFSVTLDTHTVRVSIDMYIIYQSLVFWHTLYSDETTLVYVVGILFSWVALCTISWTLALVIVCCSPWPYTYTRKLKPLCLLHMLLQTISLCWLSLISLVCDGVMFPLEIGCST